MFYRFLQEQLPRNLYRQRVKLSEKLENHLFSTRKLDLDLESENKLKISLTYRKLCFIGDRLPNLRVQSLNCRYRYVIKFLFVCLYNICFFYESSTILYNRGISNKLRTTNIWQATEKRKLNLFTVPEISSSSFVTRRSSACGQLDDTSFAPAPIYPSRKQQIMDIFHRRQNIYSTRPTFACT